MITKLLSRRTSIVCSGIATFTLMNLPTHAFAWTLVRNGTPQASIVVAKAALAPAKDDVAAQKVAQAAQDLQQYIRKISGATLPIVDDGTTPGGGLIIVGKNRLSDSAHADIPMGLTPARKEEGFVLQSGDNRLVLAGNDAGPYHGTEYAVYEFLNRLGVRWFMPGEFGEVVPQRSTIDVANMMVRESPDFIQRNWWLHTTPEMMELERRWKIRNKMNPDNVLAIPTDSSLRGFVAPEELAKTRPELFAKNLDGSVNPFYPNLSNPETVKIAADKVAEYFRQHPEANSIGIAPDDGMPRDFTPETAKKNHGFPDLGGREGVATEVSTSEEWIEWINAVAREVNKEFPGRIITTNGYANRNTPPLGVKIEPNISVMFAAIWSDTLHAFDDPKSWQNVRQGQVLKRWCELNDKIWIYGYDYNMLVSGLTPVPVTRKWARNFPLMKKWGVIGFIDETRNVWAESGIPTKYLKARLEWNANANVEEILSDFYTQWYGAAARPSRAFWDDLEETMESTPVQGHEDRVMPFIYTPELLHKLETHLTSAEKLAATPREKMHVQVDRLIFEHLRDYMQMNDAELSGDFATAATAAGHMMELRQKLHDINSFWILPDEKDYDSGVWYWTVTQRKAYYEKLADLLSGKTGSRIAMLPQRAAFRTDPYDDGRLAGWYTADWNTRDWETITTAKPFYLQGHMDSSGHAYLGSMWYQFKVAVPSSARGQRVMLYAPAIECEAWAWVNGQYVGHRPYREAYERPNEMDLDVTDALKPSQTNVITLRVSTSLNRSAQASGLLSRLFLYSPHAESATAAKPNP